ncbi:ABC transporter substrate-binding protein [Nostoc sp. UHCC 0870]|uniref:ABC transporter substrate-binding protein n=1 Tax=Nostoc sp. UHCC 0870 TaxID=2914041 RepID=UPI001EDFAFFA|nr:ABC transporter substrate-binding protein [Nostoc sp. UHCC 0870]UKP00032.1 ABC transporter substrate-binding protein [Nostoc sp. UHCC 0870]
MANNPYIFGIPVETSDSFFGRESLLNNIKDSLVQNTKFIVLHGQRRIGKSSVLKIIPLVVSPDEFLFVYCDLQAHGHSNLNEIFYAIFCEIFHEIGLDSNQLDDLLNTDSENILKHIRRLLALEVYHLVGQKKLVLLLDEFDVVTYDDTKQAVKLLQLLENLVKREDELFVVAVVGRYLNSMPSLLQVFKNAASQEIGLLDSNSAEQLIRKPASNILEYPQKTIAEICKLSSGHPFYTQALCYAIFQIATSSKNETNKISNILTDDVIEALPQAIESAEGGLGGFWEGLNIHERVVMATVAEAQESNNTNITNDPLKLLEDYGLVITDDLEEAIKTLTNKGFLDSNPIKVKVEIVRLWLRKRHPLWDEVRNLEEIGADNIESVLSVARSLSEQKGKQTNALILYEQVLHLNPNHFSNVVELAEKYLEVKEFEQALKLYERAYKVDRFSYEQALIQALEEYGHWLITQDNFTIAKQQYEKILQIEPDNSLAKQKLVEIKAFQSKNKNTSVNFRRFVVSPIALTILGLISGTGILFAGFRVFNICLPIICVPPNTIQQSNNIENSISSGDRTLFRQILNPARDRGIKSFHEGNYSKAEEEFKDAFNNTTPKDPEVLIYQNNALARQRGNPLTLAAVVPTTGKTDLSQEMLRGIAQAQDQFNQRGLKGRFLEIVIADDAGQKEQGAKVAEKLVTDESLLGVIGHLSSGVTATTLPIYEKANLPIISPTSTSTELRSSVFFRTVPSDKATGEKLATYAFRNNLRKVLIVWNPGDGYSRSIKSAFSEEFRVQFAKKQIDVDSPAEIKLATPDKMMEDLASITSDESPLQAIVFFPDTNNRPNAMEFAKMIQQDQNLQGVQLLGGDSLYTREALSIEGLVLAVPWFRNTKSSNNFAYIADTQWRGKVSWRTATSFDATQAFINSLRISTTISKYTVLENLKNVNLSLRETSGEPLTFNKSSREVQREAILLQVKKETFDVIQ